MTKLFPPKWLSKLQLTGKTLVVGLIIGYGLTLAVTLSVVVIQVKQIKQSLLTGRFNQVQTRLHRLNQTARWANFITARQIPDLRLLESSSGLGQTSWPIFTKLSQSISHNNLVDLTDLSVILQNFSVQSDNMLADLNHSWWIADQLTPENLARIDSIGRQLATATPTLTKLLSESSRILIIFQNRNELRATGGFMGSYLLLNLDRGQLTDYVFEDIYDADGQFAGFVPAPAGVKEYLSSDRGLRLPDANWNAEFSQAGPIILSYFSLGKKTDIDVLIAVNQRPLMQLLTATGPVPLPDYQTDLTADNFDQVLQDRGEFFPGSRAKTQLLDSAFDQLKSKLTTQTWSHQDPTNIMSQSIIKKDILVFSPHPDLQNLLDSLSLTGDIQSSDLIPPLYLLESNVGINKLNPWVDRELTIMPQKTQLQLQIKWHSSASPGQNYINYQRLIVPASWRVSEVLINNQPAPHLDQESVPLTSGLMATQLGFLVTVKNQDTTSVVIKLSTPPDLTQLRLIAQPGQKTYPVNIKTSDDVKTVNLDRDLVISW